MLSTLLPLLMTAMGRGREHLGEAAVGGGTERRRHRGEPQPGGEVEEGAAAPACHRGDLILLVFQGQR